MRRLLWSQLRHRRGRAAALGLAILVAAASFTLLTASARTSTIQVRHTLTRNFRGAYDILVRPRDSYTPLEREQGLVRDNYLAGIYGGITLKQAERIKRIPGVLVAAPIANIGTTLARAYVAVRLRQFVTGARDQLFRVHFSWTAQRGLSRYPGADVYAYVTRRRLFPSTGTVYGVAVTDPVTGHPDPVCDGFDTTPTVYAPFNSVDATQLDACVSTNRAPQLPHSSRGSLFALASAFAFFPVTFPINVAAIDPVEEAKLVHLDRALVSGHYLSKRDHERVIQRPAFSVLDVPAIEASRTLLDEQLDATIQRLVIPTGSDVPGLLAAGACPAPLGSCAATKQKRGPGGRRVTAYGFVRRLRGVQIARRVYDTSSIYEHAIRTQHQTLATLKDVTVDVYWRSGGVHYRQLGTTELQPVPVSNPPRAWFDGLFGDNSNSGYLDQPSDNLDVQFRKLSEAIGSTHMNNGQIGSPNLDVVGRFDPAKLPGFSPLSTVPLETYYPPALEPADARTAKMLNGRALAPSANIGGYVQQPPLILTTLAALPAFLSAQRFRGVSQRQERAPISVVRVRVAGVKGPDKLSQQRIKIVAQLIHEQTGLAVDVTAGSSPTPVTVVLPKGKFGRPALVLREGWVKKGVAVTYLRALDRKDLALFALILVVCVLFLGNGAFAAVRVRRGEIGALSTLGWSPREVFVAVLGELAVVGLVAGLVGTALAAALVHWLSLAFPLLRTLYVLPIAVVLALVAGLVPAWRAARGRPLDAIRPPVTGARRAHRVRGIPMMALVNLGRLPGRTVVGAGGLVLGVAALTVMVGIEQGFAGTLVGTLLGDAISVQVRRADFVALGLTLALSALSAADVLHLNLRERRGELVTLRTLGWSDGEVRRLVALEALVLTAGASLVGAGIGVLFGAFVLGVGLAPLAIAAAVAGGSAALAAFAASLLPVGRLHRLSAPEVLAAE